MTFPKSDADLPHPTLVKPREDQLGEAAVNKSGEAKPTFSVTYDEGLKVGYKWYDAEKKPVLFPFGHGLSYTTFAYSGLKVAPGKKVTDVTFTVKNTGSRDGAEIAQVYAAFPASASEPPKRLIGWNKVWLKAGESKQIRVPVESKYLSIWDDSANEWKLRQAPTKSWSGASSANLPLHDKFDLK